MLYNAAGQITQMKYLRSGSNYYTETRGYNVLQQMTQLTVSRTSTILDYRYTFSDTQNNGRITQRQELVSGETVQYQYDSLKRLTSAATTGPEWGQSFGYDGFGNLLQQTVTKGSAPSLSVNVNPATNRITTGGYGYDSNGNLTAMPNLTMSYDVENRLVQATQTYNGTELYGYDPSGRRVWKQEPSRTLVYFYGIEGNLLRTLGDGDDTDSNVYFGGKLIWAEASQGLAAGPVSPDRLGSAALRNNVSAKYFPYGEEGTTTTQDRTKFATYYRDQVTALDYAHNRYYARTIGRFSSPDPYRASGGPADPQSWNRYAYVQNDPVNYFDRHGLLRCNPDVCGDGDDEGGDVDDGGYGDDPAWSQRPPVAQAPKKPTNSQKAIRGIRTAVQALTSEEFSEALGRASDVAINALETAVIVDTDLGFKPSVSGTKGNSSYELSFYPAATPEGSTSSFELNSNPALYDLSQVPVGTLSDGTPATGNLLSDLENYYGLKPGSVTAQRYWAIFELHELGHLFGGLESDGNNKPLSLKNTGLVIDHCFKELKK